MKIHTYWQEEDPNIEESATNKYVSLLPETVQTTVSKVSCMGRFVKPKVEKIIGSNLSSNNVLVTDA